MTKARRNAGWAGIFFILASAAPISTSFFVGFLGEDLTNAVPVPDYLTQVAMSSERVAAGALIELVWALSVVAVPVMLFPILREQDEAGALGFFFLRLMEGTSVMVHAILLLALSTLGQQFVQAAVEDTAGLLNTADTFLIIRQWTFLVGSGLIWSLSALLLNVLLYQSRIVPRWLSIWGFVGALLAIANYGPAFFGATPMPMLFIPIALQEMGFALWLIFRGVDLDATHRATGATDPTAPLRSSPA